MSILQNINEIRNDFPILSEQIHGRDLVYLDNAASTHKPLQVINSISNHYEHNNSNIHRGVHLLSQRATENYENAREKVRNFLNAKSTQEIIFTRGATESINLIASSWGRKNINAGDEILISTMEHHANIVPWQLLCQEKGAILKITAINDDGEIIFEEFEKLLSEKTKLVSIVHVSNTLGTVNPIEKIIEKAHSFGAKVLIDGAQSVPHFKVDMQKCNCDFFVFSGHKLYAPSGIGVLYTKKVILESMPPYQSGGDMILSVSFEKTTFNELPFKFEAGTPNIEGAIGLGFAIDYITNLGLENIKKYEDELLKYGTEKLSQINDLRIIGTAKEKAGVISFVLDSVHPHDVGTMLDLDGIAIRTGHHCTEPLMKRFKVPATSRASFAFYNSFQEIDKLTESIQKVIKMFG
ncbi:MAG: cysteine desulfurase [Candidatus Kapabacteria bacterium]|nr:cysteine desulfurase [Candidatus Kapabacteria bacterium]